MATNRSRTERPSVDLMANVSPSKTCSILGLARIDRKSQRLVMNGLMLTITLILQAFILGAPSKPAFAETSRVFIETDGAIVIWKDLEIPKDKSYESVIVMNGHVVFSGTTSHLILVRGRVHLTSDAKVLSGLTILEGQVERDEGAIIPNEEIANSANSLWQGVKNWWREKKEKFEGQNYSFDGSLLKLITLPAGFLGVLFILVVLALITGLIFLVAPSLSHRADEVFQKSPLRSAFAGILAYILAGPLALILIVSIVGLLALPFYILFVFIAAMAGLFAGLRGLGFMILRSFGVRQGFLAFLLGVILSGALLMIPVIGTGLFFLLWITGTGALLLGLFQRPKMGDPSVIEASWSPKT